MHDAVHEQRDNNIGGITLMDNLQQIQFPVAVVWGVASLATFLWVLWRQRKCLTLPFVFRHLMFILCLYLGVLWFVYEDKVTTLVFGKAVSKGSPAELPAGLVILAGVIFWFFIAVVVLGKNRRAEFGFYREAFRLRR